MPRLNKEQKARLTEIINEAFEKLVAEEIIEENRKSKIVKVILSTIMAILG